MEGKNMSVCCSEDGACGAGMCGDGKCSGGCGDCGCIHHAVMPWLVVAFGSTFLLGALNVLDADIVNFIWPAIIVLAGLKMVFARMCKCC